MSKTKKKLRRRNRNREIKKGNMVFFGEKQGIYKGMEGLLATVSTINGRVNVPFKNLKKDMGGLDNG